jgi:hypothetical protein
MKHGLVWAVASAALLIACTSGLEITRAPVTAAARVAVPAERVAGQTGLVVRAYQKDASGKSVEVQNAVCDLRSPEFQARVSTPQQVRYPQFIQAARFAGRGQPGTLTVTCRAGNAQGQTTSDAVPLNVTPTYSAPVTTTTSTGQTLTTSTSTLYSKQLASSYPWHYGAIIRVDME